MKRSRRSPPVRQTSEVTYPSRAGLGRMELNGTPEKTEGSTNLRRRPPFGVGWMLACALLSGRSRASIDVGLRQRVCHNVLALLINHAIHPSLPVWPRVSPRFRSTGTTGIVLCQHRIRCLGSKETIRTHLANGDSETPFYRSPVAPIYWAPGETSWFNGCPSGLGDNLSKANEDCSDLRIPPRPKRDEHRLCSPE